MRRSSLLPLATVVLLAAEPTVARAAATEWVGSPRAAVRLLTGVDAVGAGDTIPAGLAFRLGDGWHAYWRTPGDAGVAPRIDRSASTNVADVRVAWPAPHRLEISGLQNATYADGFVLPLTVTRGDTTAAAHVALAVDYAICGKICVPAHADLVLDVPAGAAVPSPEAATLAAAWAMVPATAAQAGFSLVDATITPAPAGRGRMLTLTLHSEKTPFVHPDLFIESTDPGLPPAPAVTLRDGGRTAVLAAPLPEDAGDRLTLTIVDGDRAAEIPFVVPAPIPPAAPHGLAAILIVALLGGLILNVMPCVLPVLVIKLASVLRHAEEGRREARLGFVATACGIVASFLALAAGLVGLKAAGAEVGWGIQFQQPWFLAALAVVTTLFAASLFDWLHLGVPAVLSRLPGPRGGRAQADAFLAGVTATLLATPCSAPFVGTAVGFALSRGPLEILAVFASLGLGMALPFLVVAAVPGTVAWLPRPGAWMLRVRQVSGVLLLGTAAWLVVLLGTLAGPIPAAGLGVLLVGLLLLRFALSKRPAAARAGSLATAALAAAAIGVTITAPAKYSTVATDDDWAPFDEAAIAPAVVAGRTVLVDVTASWCLTCKVNDLSTLDRSEVRARLARADTLRMRAAWDRPDPRITAYLQRFGRFGIPFDIVYGPGRPEGAPLPELLTPSVLFSGLDTAGSPMAAKVPP